MKRRIAILLLFVCAVFGDTFHTHLKPNVASTLDLGTVALPWRTAYADTFTDGAFIITGGKVTAGEWNGDPIDIGDFTNLTATSPITLTGDDIGLDQSAVDHGSIGGLDDPDHNASYFTETEMQAVADPTGASLVGLTTGAGSPTVNDIQQYLDNTGSSGYFTGGILSDGGSGTLDVTAGEGFIRASADDNAPLISFKFAASNGIAIPDDTTRYVFVDDTGTINLNADEFTEAVDNIMLGVVTDEGGAVSHAFNLGVRLQDSIGQLGRYIRRVDDVVRNRRKGGLVFGQSGDVNRFVTISEGQLEWGRTSYPIPAFNTSGANTFDTYSAGGQEATGVSAWPNTQYDNAGTLTTMTNNRWAVLWWYIEPDGHIVLLYGRAQYVTEGQAEDEEVPASSIPNRLSSASVIASKFIFQKGEDIAEKIETAFGTPFTGSGVTAHNNLATLAWTSAGHTGTVSTFAGFDGAGAATEYTEANYLLADGSRALAGAWDMGSQALTNVNIDSGTLAGITEAQIDNVNINGNTINATSGDLTITAAGGDIDFGDDNLATTGTGAFGNMVNIVGQGAGNSTVNVGAGVGNNLAILVSNGITLSDFTARIGTVSNNRFGFRTASTNTTMRAWENDGTSVSDYMTLTFAGPGNSPGGNIAWGNQAHSFAGAVTFNGSATFNVGGTINNSDFEVADNISIIFGGTDPGSIFSDGTDMVIQGDGADLEIRGFAEVRLGDGTNDVNIGTTGNMSFAGSSKLFPPQVNNADLNANVAGTAGEMVFNLNGTTFYGCTVTGGAGAATWVAFH